MIYNPYLPQFSNSVLFQHFLLYNVTSRNKTEKIALTWFHGYLVYLLRCTKLFVLGAHDFQVIHLMNFKGLGPM